MPRLLRLAVVVANQDQQPGPSLADCQRFVESGEDSMLAYWRDNAGHWFTVSGVDYYGPVTLAGIPAEAGRAEVMDMAVTAVGTPLQPHDLLITLITQAPGVSLDAGAVGNRALIPTDQSHTFACHEFGHIVGLDHTCGIPNTGGDWIDNNQPDYFPWYGDPYDVMSAMTFGDSDPTTELPASSAVSGFAGSRRAGPMLSRAMLHHTAPDGIPDEQILHVYQDGTVESPLLYPVGSSDGPTVLVWHPTGEDERGRGRVYVEYRQPFDAIPASRWDGGLARTGPARDRCGVVVHVVKDVPGSEYAAVWYSGRVIPQTPDEDVVVDTGRGEATVSLFTDPDDDPVAPVRVRVRVDAAAPTYVRVEETPHEDVTVTEVPGHVIPGFEFMDPFPRERREVVRTVVYVPHVFGLGGESPYDEPTQVSVRWYLGGYMLTDASGVAERLPSGGSAPVGVDYAIEPATGTLRVSNRSVADSFSLEVQCLALAGAAEVTAYTSYSVQGTTEGWGEAARRFLDYWDRITHPIPKVVFRPPGWGTLEVDRVERAWQELYAVRPQAAQALWQVHQVKLNALRAPQR